MGRINLNNSGKYQTSSATNYFTLADDKDQADVVFLYDEEDGSDIDYYLCHRAKVDGYDRWVNCNAIDEDGNDNPEDCAMCRENQPRSEKLFLQLYNLTEEKKQVWERGTNFVGTISSFIERYGQLVSQPLEVVRNGRKGDQRTTYQLFPLDSDPDATIEDFGGRDELLGNVILDLDDEEMYEAIDGNYHLPDNNSNNNSSTSTRRNSSARSNTRATSTERRQRTEPQADSRRSQRSEATNERRTRGVERSERRSSPSARRSSPRR